MHSRLTVPTNIWTTLRNFKVKYFNETIVDKLSIPLLLNIKKELKQADVIHLQAIFNTPTPVVLFMAQKLKKPLLLSPRGALGDWILKNGNPFKKCWLKYCIKPFANQIHWHATSVQEKNEILKLFPKAQVHIVPNGIDLAELTKEIEPGKGRAIFNKFDKIEKNGPRIVSMGRIHAKKGFDILIQAFKLLLLDYPSATLFIAGQDEGELHHLEQLVLDMGLINTVFFTRQLDKKSSINFLAEADVFALSSHNENFGNVYLEALACGTPIVASTYTPWEEVVEGKCGLWVENTPEKFYTAMKTILNNKEVYNSENCIKLAATYSWKSVAASLSTIFEKMALDASLKQ